jgi:hypothetical protein
VAAVTLDAKVKRIKHQRFERGRADARIKAPPTEANAEYQAGYVATSRSRCIADDVTECECDVCRAAQEDWERWQGWHDDADSVPDDGVEP